MLNLKNQLAEDLAAFFSFSGHNLFFPPGPVELSYIAAEKKMFVPLVWRDQFLGVMLFEGVKAGEFKKIMPFLPQTVSLALDKLALAKAGRLDAATGLASEESFFLHMIDQVGNLQSDLADPGFAGREAYRMCLGMAVIVWRDARRLAHQFDYELCERIYLELASAIGSSMDVEAVAAPLGRYEGRYEFGILFAAPGRGACHKIAARALDRLEKMVFVDGPSKRKIKVKLAAGHAQYPRDMRGSELRLPILEQAIRLRDRARLAAHVGAGMESSRRIMAYAQILKKGGRVLENMGRGKLRINLGRAANATEGLRFNVISADGQCEKGQIVLLNVGIKDSLAEILYLEQAGLLPESGDRLVLLAKTGVERDDGPRPFNASDFAGMQAFLGHGEFLALFGEIARSHSVFTLGIIRIDKSEDGQAEQLSTLKKLAQTMSVELKPDLAGSYGSNGLIFFHGGRKTAEIMPFYSRLREESGLDLYVGLFCWPFLNFSRLDSESCALKALEYARLLPEPHIGVLDSLALNISADKKYSLGDSFGAIEEYKLALLANPANAMARNSLAVCMAALGKMDEARKLLEQALSDAADDALKARICYNLGAVWQKQNDLRFAKRMYQKCVKLDPEYFYGWIRLGHLSEDVKARARKYYQRALEIAAENPDLFNVAQRHLAKLEVRANNREDARAMLYDALLRDPEDSASMLLLAKMYLDNQEDPRMAEALARKSVALTATADGWHTLAQALDAQGRTAEAATARSRAHA